MKIYKEPDTADGIEIWHLEQDNGGSARITNFGAMIMDWKVMHQGAATDIVLGFDTVAEYKGGTYRSAYPYFGAVIGRCANRIENGQFTLEGKKYHTPQNLPPNTLHGGTEGFDSKIWKVMYTEAYPTPMIVLHYQAADGEEGFPGAIDIAITYWLGENELSFTMEYRARQTTIANLTQHTYFNLNGGKGDIRNHIVTIPGSRYLAQDDTQNANGEVLPAAGTVYDFTKPTAINAHGDENAGYDLSYEIDGYDGKLRLCADCVSPDSGLHLQVFTTEPTVHLYTGRWIPELTGKEGNSYGPYSGLCFETQQHANGINIPHFPSGVLQAGERYIRSDVYKIV
jgi:aldose 1-epimerase